MVAFTASSRLAAAGILSLMFSTLASADSISYDSDTYEAGAEQPYQTFVSSPNVNPPEMLVYTKAAGISDGYVFLGIDGSPSAGKDQTVPCIFDFSNGDTFGTLVWCGLDYDEETADFRVQTYKDEPVLTFWRGTVHATTGHGDGSYYMLNQSYAEIAHFNATGFPGEGDMHEFQLTEDDTALVIVYTTIQLDLTSVNGTADGYAWDCYFQEINIETGEILFHWNASQFLSVNETYNDIGSAGDATTPFDWFHMNSIQKDADGNYLISSRTLWSIIKINGTDGSVIWRFGGRETDFELPDDGIFRWQHDARWTDTSTQTQLSLFDDGDWDTGLDAYSRGLVFAIDQDAMTCSLTSAFHNGKETLSEFEGNLQCIDCSNATTNWLIGYGSEPFFTEVTSDGDVVLDVQFAVDNVINSYRAYKFDWTGTPTTNPNISWTTSNNTAYVSWNGATEVKKYQVFTAKSTSATWTHLTALDTARTGFETEIDMSSVSSNLKKLIRIKALDSNGDILGWTDATDGTSTYSVASSTSSSSSSTESGSSDSSSSTSSSSSSNSTATSGAGRASSPFAFVAAITMAVLCAM